jgi:hypothetical protein
MGLLSGSTSSYKSVDRTNFTATNGQTTFTVTQGYNVGDVDVYLNGVKLVEGDDYYATNGTAVVVNSACATGDVIQVVSYNQFLTANSYTKSETDSRYMVATGSTPMTSYLRTPNYGVSSWSDSANASLEASNGAGTNGVGIKAWGRSVAGSGGELTYITDTRGASGQHIWYGYNGSVLSQFMKIDTAGRINTTNQPIMVLDGNGGSQAYNGVITTFTQVLSRGGMTWTSGNGRVTVPVAGLYRISLQVYHYQTGSVRTTINVNGTEITLAHSSNTTTADETRYQCTVRQLAANDYIDFRTTGNYNIYTGSRHSYAVVEMIG